MSVPEQSANLSNRQELKAPEFSDESPPDCLDRLVAVWKTFDGLLYAVNGEYGIESLNSRAAERFGAHVLGQICYRVLYHRDDPCPWCGMDRIRAGETLRQEFQDPTDGRWFGGAAAPWPGRSALPGRLALLRDITACKTLQQRLEQSEEHFRLLAENSRDLICLQTLQGRWIYASPSSRSLLGYAPEELRQVPLVRLYHPEDRHLAPHHVAEAELLRGEVIRRTFRVRHRDGHYLWLESETVPVFQQSRRVAHLLILARDISRQKQVEQAFARRANELNCLLQMTELVEQYRGSLDEILQKAADLLPTFWPPSQAVCARIVYLDHPYASRDFRRTPWRLGAEIRTGNRSVGQVEVCYRKKTSDTEGDSGAAEERRLLHAVAERLAGLILRTEAEEELRRERQALQESNIAMRELMARIQEEKHEIARAMQNNVDTVVLPMLEDLRRRLPEQYQRQLDILRFNLEEITSPFVDRISRAFQNLSPAELRVCEMVRRGLSSKEIAHVLHLSPSTVHRHREHIRRKLGLTNQGRNLVSFLNAQALVPSGGEG